MKLPYFILTPKELAEYIQSNVDIHLPNFLVPNKILELVAALVLARFHLKQTGEHSNFAFPLKEYPSSIDSIAEMIKKNIDEDTPVDIQLINSEISLNEKYRGKIKAPSFQLKRFDLSSNNNNPQLKKFLTEEIPEHYSQVAATLVIIFEGIGVIQIKEINKAIHLLNKYPFANVIYITVEDSNEITIGEIWPRNGSTRFTQQEWFTSSLEGESTE